MEEGKGGKGKGKVTERLITSDDEEGKGGKGLPGAAGNSTSGSLTSAVKQSGKNHQKGGGERPKAPETPEKGKPGKAGKVHPSPARKVDVRLPGKGNSNSHGARPVHLIITMIKWIRTSRLSIKNSLCWGAVEGTREGETRGGRQGTP